jgi:hypothetical protein
MKRAILRALERGAAVDGDLFDPVVAGEDFHDSKVTASLGAP